MAEAMAVETIAEAYWMQKGYWTRLRFPFRAGKRGWSDVDLLAYRPPERHLVISESKVRFEKTKVFADSKDYASEVVTGRLSEYLSFDKNVARVCEAARDLTVGEESISRLTIQLVSNYYLTSAQEQAISRVREATTRELVRDFGDVDVKYEFVTTGDLICQIIAAERRNTQGRRYGHPILDMAREMNRYLVANVAGRGGKGNVSTTFRSACWTTLQEVLAPPKPKPRGRRKH